MAAPSVRIRIDFGEDCAVGPGKVALLEAIGRSGSLSQAARELDMSYRRAWLLLESLNTSFRQPVADLSRGGAGGGGAIVTAFGTSLIEAFRSFEADCGARASRWLAQFARQVAGGSAAAVPRRRLARPTPPRARA